MSPDDDKLGNFFFVVKGSEYTINPIIFRNSAFRLGEGSDKKNEGYKREQKKFHAGELKGSKLTQIDY